MWTLDDLNKTVKFLPVLDVSTMETIGAEATVIFSNLLRYSKISIQSNLGNSCPELQTNLDLWCIKEVCKKLSSQQESDELRIPITIPLCRATITTPLCMYDIGMVMREYNIPPNYIRLVIPDGMEPYQNLNLYKSLFFLKKKGFQLCTSDLNLICQNFTGNNTLLINSFKLKKELYQEEYSYHKSIILTSILEMCQKLQIQVIG